MPRPQRGEGCAGRAGDGARDSRGMVPGLQRRPPVTTRTGSNSGFFEGCSVQAFPCSSLAVVWRRGGGEGLQALNGGRGGAEKGKGAEGGLARHPGQRCPLGHPTPGTELGPKGLLLPWTCPDPFDMTLGQI